MKARFCNFSRKRLWPQRGHAPRWALIMLASTSLLFLGKQCQTVNNPEPFEQAIINANNEEISELKAKKKEYENRLSWTKGKAGMTSMMGGAVDPTDLLEIDALQKGIKEIQKKIDELKQENRDIKKGRKERQKDEQREREHVRETVGHVRPEVPRVKPEVPVEKPKPEKPPKPETHTHPEGHSH